MLGEEPVPGLRATGSPRQDTRRASVPVKEQVWWQVSGPRVRSVWQMAVRGDGAALDAGGGGLAALSTKKCQFYCSFFKF